MNIYDSKESKEITKSIESRLEHNKYKHSHKSSESPEFTRHGDNFKIDARYLKVATAEDGVRNSQGYYYNQASYTYDPIPFAQLRFTLARLRYIKLNDSEFDRCDKVLKAFTLNDRAFKEGDGFGAAVWHADRVKPTC
ncbi:hypothetical protein [Vibrio superstes]|uniref:Uncharacterized protein n=1 Tax=Vibrio superstes NBRC 103154 TaxID=1219062 RepID=A0A511QR69_9VIBR|nr:hypothetical protein [Vibrio superstes]GEM79577.1 hypothetical protein VSU01S_18220 [Vibrio superstes NBRC 103154]